nr:hypothetical protein [Mycobacteroides chelonae]
MFVGAGQPGFESGAFLFEFVQFLPDFVAGHKVISGKVDQARFFGIDGRELAVQAGVQFAGTCLVVGHGGFQALSHIGDECLRQPEGGVVVHDGVLNQMNWLVRQVAVPLLVSPAQEVLVVTAVVAFDFSEDQAGVFALPAATLTEQRVLEVVHMDAVALTVARAGIEHILHLIEQGLTDQCFVPSRIQLVFVAHESGVVRIAQHLLQRRRGNRSSWRDSLGRTTGEPKVSQGGFQTGNGVLAACIQLPRPAQQGSTLGVQTDRVHELPAEFGSDIQVADLGQRYGAPGTGFTAHLGFNI